MMAISGVVWWVLIAASGGIGWLLVPALYGFHFQLAGGLAGVVVAAWIKSGVLALRYTNPGPVSLWLSGLVWRSVAFGIAGVIWLAWGYLVARYLGNWLASKLPPVPFGIFMTALIFAPIFWFDQLNGWVKVALAKILLPVRRLLRSGQAGEGGSARFAGVLDDWANPMQPGALLLGKSLFEPAWRVAIKDNRHALTVAGSGGGKGRSVIIPNLLEWPGSVLVVDPKGTNAAVTAAARGAGGGRVDQGMGQKVHCLNPFKIGVGLPGMPSPSRFNPLSVLDVSGVTRFEDVDMIADALVIPGKGDPHWSLSARSLLRGLIDYAALTIPGANLGHVRDLITDPAGVPLQDMITAGGIAKEAASQLLAASDREMGSILSTAIQQTDWLSSAALREAVSVADFDFMELKRTPTTVYLILPLEYLETHARFLRLFVNLAVKAATVGGSSKVPLLFLLDEFYSLGPLQSLAKAAANIRSYGVKLWPIIQNISQLREHYPENWQGFFANAAFVQFFAVNDRETADYVAARLGRRFVQSGGGVSIVEMRTGEEVSRETGRDSGRLLVLREGADPFMLRRVDYDKAYPGNRYNPDPDHS